MNATDGDSVAHVVLKYSILGDITFSIAFNSFIIVWNWKISTLSIFIVYFLTRNLIFDIFSFYPIS